MKRSLALLGGLLVLTTLTLAPKVAHADTTDFIEGYVCNVNVYDESYTIYAWVQMSMDPDCATIDSSFYVYKDFIYTYDFKNTFDLVVDWLGRAAIEGYQVEAWTAYQCIFYGRWCLDGLRIEGKLAFWD